MSEPAESAFKIRPAFVLWFLAALGWLVIIAGFVCWWGLPRWMPETVVEESPWFGPAFEAVIHGGKARALGQRLPEWGASVVPTLCEIADSGAEQKRRLLALHLLADCEATSTATPILLPLLRDPDAKVASKALDALWKHQGPEMAEPLLVMLPHLTTIDAGRVAHLLAEFREPVPFTLIATHLLDQPRVDLQQCGCIVLRTSRDPQAIPALVARLSRSHAKLSYSASYALGRSVQPNVTEVIITLMQDPDPDLRWGAVRAAAWRLGEQNIARVEIDRLRTPLLRSTTDPDPGVRNEALGNLSSFPDSEVIAILHAAVIAGGEPGLRAVSSLRRMSTAEMVPLLVGLLRHEDAAIRRELLYGLGNLDQITDPDHIATILTLLDDPDAEVRKRAAWLAQRLELTPEQQQTLDAHHQ
jgi:HEAT repeat protein